MPGIMRLFVRVADATPFSLILDDNLLPEHYERIAVKYFKEQWHGTRQAPDLILMRRVVFRNSDQLLEFRRRKPRQTQHADPAASPRPLPAAPSGDIGDDMYGSGCTAERVRSELVTTNPPVASLGAMCDTELLIKSITVPRLIMKLSDPTCTAFLEDVFWDTYRSFATPGQVLDALIARYDAPPLAKVGQEQRSPLDEQYYAQLAWRVKLRVFELLQHWVERAFFDFSDDAVFAKLRRFAHDKVDHDGAPASLLLRMQQLDRRALSTRPAPVIPGVVSRTLAPAEVLSKYTDAHIAQQLTLLTRHFHSHIHPSELLGRQWEGATAEHVPHFIQYRHFINRLSNWVAYTIVSPGDTAQRAGNMAQLLRVCDELFKIHNWDALVAIYGGIVDPAVARLKSVEQHLTREQQALLGKFDELLNNKGASKALKAAMASSPRPRFPSLVVHLRDLVFLDDTRAVTDGVVNWMRCIHEYNLVRFLLDGRDQALPYVPDPVLQGVFAHWVLVSDAALTRMSKAAQP